MATPTLTDFETYAPALADDSRAGTFLAMAIRRHINESPSWGDMFAEAMVYYAAHKLQKMIEANTLAAAAIAGGGSSVAGAVISRTAGRESISYANSAATATSGGGSISPTHLDLLTTSYGIAYLDILNSRAYSGPTVVW